MPDRPQAAGRRAPERACGIRPPRSRLPRQSRIHITFADPVPDADVARAAIRVKKRRVRLHRPDRIGEYRQVLVLDLDQSQGSGGGLLRGGNNGRHLIADEADNVGSGFGDPGPHSTG